MRDVRLGVWLSAICVGLAACSASEGPAPAGSASSSAQLQDAVVTPAAPRAPHFVGQMRRAGDCAPPARYGLIVQGETNVVHGSTRSVVEVLDADSTEWLPDGRLFAVAGDRISIWDPVTGTSVSGPPVPSGAEDVRAMRLGATDYVGWRLDKRFTLRALGSADVTMQVDGFRVERWVPFGSAGFVADDGREARGFRLDGTEIFRTKGQGGTLLRASLDGHVVLIGGELRKAPDAPVLQTFGWAARIDPSGARVAGNAQGQVEVFDVGSAKSMTFAMAEEAFSFTWRDDGGRLAFGTRQGEVFVWDMGEAAPRSWGVVPDRNELQVLGEIVMVDVRDGTVALGPSGIVARTELDRCTFARAAVNPLVALCNKRCEIATFDGTFHSERIDRWDNLHVEYEELLGLRVEVLGDREARLFTREDSVTPPEVERRLELLRAMSQKLVKNVVIEKNTVSLLVAPTGEVGATFEVALGEKVVGASADGEAGLYAWGASTLSRYPPVSEELSARSISSEDDPQIL